MTAAHDLVLAPAPTTVRTGVRAVLSNPVPFRRREWTFVSVPFGSLTDDRLVFVTDRGLHLRAIRCEDVAQHSTIYRVFAPFDGLQSLSGEFALPDVDKHDPFVFHPWCADAPTKLIPKLELRLRNSTGTVVSYRTNEPFTLFETEFSNDCMIRFHFRSPLGNSGFIAEGWVTFYDNSPVADIQVAVVWSDRTNPAHDIQIEGLFFLSGEPVVFDFAVRTGMTERPVFNGQEWVTLVCTSIGFIDGSGLPLVGRMICWPEHAASLPVADMETYNSTDPHAQMAQDVETLIAAVHGPTLGVCAPHTWNGKLLANRNTPRFGLAQEHLEARVDAAMDQFFANTLKLAGQFYDLRLIGIGKMPGQTGDQQDFGAAKGWEATVAGDPRWLHYALYSVVCDFFRGVMHYEGGQRLDPKLHPNWRTWSGDTHFSSSVSPDRLNKRIGVWGDRTSTGWAGYDDEHRSQTNLATLYALTGWPILRFIIEHYSTVDIANVRHALEFGFGAPRAVGRTMHCWANFLTLFPAGSETHKRYRALMDKMAATVTNQWLGGQTPGPVDILADRVDPRMGIVWNGVVMPAWSCWEHGLFAVGAYAAWKATKDARWLDLVRRVTRTIVRYATFKDAQGWSFVATCHYPKAGIGPTGVAEGEPMPEQWYSRTSPMVTPLNGDVSSWTQNAVLIFIETHEADDPDMARALEIAQTFMPADQNDGRTAEWQACVKCIPAKAGDWRTY